ncbi:hypothetical protein VaNZ11_001866 [Volvox africanus]|uniref:Secreted protein n=1 Tax=Volvox africanus TaxID=51714 RepID=A0ABQ5RQQ9_9CHLO|nr:hypothetical protein VaNZ11_001866 [Volvox africanus]
MPRLLVFPPPSPSLSRSVVVVPVLLSLPSAYGIRSPPSGSATTIQYNVNIKLYSVFISCICETSTSCDLVVMCGRGSSGGLSGGLAGREFSAQQLREFQLSDPATRRDLASRGSSGSSIRFGGGSTRGGGGRGGSW